MLRCIGSALLTLVQSNVLPISSASSTYCDTSTVECVSLRRTRLTRTWSLSFMRWWLTLQRCSLSSFSRTSLTGREPASGGRGASLILSRFSIYRRSRLTAVHIYYIRSSKMLVDRDSTVASIPTGIRNTYSPKYSPSYICVWRVFRREAIPGDYWLRNTGWCIAVHMWDTHLFSPSSAAPQNLGRDMSLPSSLLKHLEIQASLKPGWFSTLSSSSH